jgi:uncharacterized protein
MSSIDVVRKHYAASEAGDLEAMMADFAPNIVWTEAAGFPTAGVYTGRQEIIDGVFGPTDATWNDFAVGVERLIEDADTVVMIGNYTGIAKSTGKPLNIRTVHVWTVQAGQIVAFEQICDSHSAQLALAD